MPYNFMCLQDTVCLHEVLEESAHVCPNVCSEWFENERKSAEASSMINADYFSAKQNKLNNFRLNRKVANIVQVFLYTLTSLPLV